MNLYVGMTAATLVWSLVAFLAAKLIGLKENDLYIMWGALTALGVLASGAFVWWKQRQEAAAAAEGEQGGAPEQGGADEVELLVRDAENRLSAARLATGSHISNLPLVFVIGEQGSVKTSTVINSGLEAELLAGHVFQENLVAPTRTANIWFAKGAIFVEAAAKLLSDQTRWTKLIKKLKPGALKSVMGGKTQSPRAVVLCCDSETFVRAGAGEVLAALSRNLHARLGDISETLGISYPVYVLFTRCDRLPFFADYVRTLTNEEAGQVLGVTLPIRPAHTSGVYAEEETARLTNAFSGLYHSLADKRLMFLPREQDLNKVPGAYEFPREFRKIRGPLVQFLVDICRPSQLRASPFLRGFYFSGVRPVVVQEVSVPSTPAPVERKAFEASGSATGMFSVPKAPQAAAQAVAPQVTGTKRVPQWIFLTRLFNNIILQDRAALDASGSSTKTSAMQRILLGAAAVLALVFAIGWTVSYFNNRALLNEAQQAAAAIPPGAQATPETLQKLETLRQSLDTLTTYELEGEPFNYGWALYAGDDAYPHVRCAYYKRFNQLLFAPVFGGLQQHLASRPATPAPSDEYGPTYETLKAYLITGNHKDFRNLQETDRRQAVERLGALLTARYAAVRPGDVQIPQKQFDFFAKDLVASAPPCLGAQADADPVDRGRSYLSRFSGTERVYNYLISDASRQNPPVNYNRDIKGTAEAVLNNKDVAGAYTKPGWDWMQKAFGNINKYFGGDQWVLGGASAAKIDPATVDQLRGRYMSDYINQWRTYLKNTAVLRYRDLKDASNKLNLQSGVQTPILAVFWLAAKHTGVDPKVQEAFKPVHDVVPAGQGEYIGPSNEPYHRSLGTLFASIESVANLPGPPDAAAAAPSLSAAQAARLSAMQTIKRIDQDAHIESVVQKLLQDPITNAEGLLRSLGPAELNAKGAAMCAELSPVLKKYPFNSSATAEATLPEVDSVFKPGTGIFWQNYEANFKNFISKDGNPNPTAPIPLNPAWIQWFKTFSGFSNSLYPGGQGPRLTYTLTPVKPEGYQSATFTIDGQALTITQAGGAGKQFVWPGPAQGARLSVKAPDVPEAPIGGLWAAWHLFHGAERWTPAGAGYNIEWFFKFADRYIPSSTGAPLAVRLHVDNSIFRKGAFANLNCVPRVAR